MGHKIERHTHEHTHEVNCPDGSLAHDSIEHSHEHVDDMNVHHHYTEEPKDKEKINV